MCVLLPLILLSPRGSVMCAGFQEDTFATDSLQHILSLLGALDVHGFKLLSSLTLTNRSRIKDLWVFTGGSGETGLPESPPTTPNQSSLDLKRHETPESGGATVPRHLRSSSAPGAGGSTSTLVGTFQQHTPSHQRTATGGSLNAPESPSRLGKAGSGVHAPRVLRKPSPKVALLAAAGSSTGSLVRTPLPMSYADPIRASLASEVGSAENMTGVGISRFRYPEADEAMYGTPRMEMQRPRMPVTEVIYETGGEGGSRETSPSAFMQDEDPFRREVPLATPTTGRALPMPPATVTRMEYGPSPPHSGPESSPSPPAVSPHYDAAAEQSPSPPILTQSTGASGRRTPPEQPRTPSPPTAHSSTLLSPGMFRNSAFTTSTGWRSTEIPIHWTGPTSGERDSAVNPRAGHDSGVGMMLGPREQTASALLTTGPKLPGAWLTPVDERQDDPMASQTRLATLPAPAGPRLPGGPRASHSPPAASDMGGPPPSPATWQAGPRAQTPEKHRVDARVSSPAVASGLVRKSEAGVVGLMPAVPTPLRPPLPTPPTAPRSQERISPPPHMHAQTFPREPRTAPLPGDGWVLVDVDPHHRRTPPPQRPAPRPRSTSDSFVNPRRAGSPVVHSAGGAKATLTVGTVDTGRASPQAHNKRVEQVGQSGIRRLFSLSRQDGAQGASPKKGRRGSAGDHDLERLGSDGSRRNMFGRRKQVPEQHPVRQRVKLD